jgi:RNA polymerase-binding transcription factor DksA
LQQLCEALDRMERGVYGRCVHCHRPIKRDVMNKSPLALMCPHCAGDTDRGARMASLEDP